LAAARELKLSQTDDLIAKARGLMARLDAQKEVHDMLIAAVASKNPKDIAAAMSAATKSGATDDEAFHQCVALKARVTEVAQVTQDVERAIKAREIRPIHELLVGGCAACGPDALPPRRARFCWASTSTCPRPGRCAPRCAQRRRP
jgi:hypothetical protein